MFNKKLQMFNKKLKEEIKEKGFKIERLEAEVKQLKNLEVINKDILEVNNKLCNKLNKAEGKVREQTESDIYFSCAKIQKKLIEVGKKEDVNVEKQFMNSLLEQQRVQQMSAQMNTYYDNSFVGLRQATGALAGFLR